MKSNCQPFSANTQGKPTARPWKSMLGEWNVLSFWKRIMYTCMCTYVYIYIYGGCPKFFLLETAILSRKKFTLAKLSPYSQKTFAGPYVALYLGIFVRKQKLDKGNLRVRATIKTHSVAAAHSRVAFCLYRWSLLTFSGQFWHSHTETKGSPASRLSWKQDITSQQFRPPSFQEKAVFRQALSKLSPNFREKSPYINSSS